MPHLVCFGLSYSARALVSHLRSNNKTEFTLSATCRNGESRAAAEAFGAKPLAFSSDASKEAVKSADFILSSIPPGADGDPVLADYSETLSRSSAKWIGYLSTTGPYGDCGGALVDETAPVNPSGPRGQRRADAERGWLSLAGAQKLPVHIFRLPGLYGPGRSSLDKIRDGSARRVVKKGHVFSRIHIDDLANILSASMERPRSGAIYNVADDLAAPPQDVVAYAAELLKRDPPPEIDFETAALSPMAKSFYGDNKRVSNALIKSELGITLAYPTYREGLAAILKTENR